MLFSQFGMLFLAGLAWDAILVSHVSPFWVGAAPGSTSSAAGLQCLQVFTCASHYPCPELNLGDHALGAACLRPPFYPCPLATAFSFLWMPPACASWPGDPQQALGRCRVQAFVRLGITNVRWHAHLHECLCGTCMRVLRSLSIELFGLLAPPAPPLPVSTQGGCCVCWGWLWALGRHSAVSVSPRSLCQVLA